MSTSQIQYPVVAEIWSQLEATLLGQARKLAEDIAKRQGAEPKELWAKLKPMIRIGLLDVELPEPLPTLCTHPLGSPDGAIYTRCRAPCVLGFDACATHIHKPQSSVQQEAIPTVKRVLDYQGNTYFVHENSVAYDKTGTPRGIVKEDALCLFAET